MWPSMIRLYAREAQRENVQLRPRLASELRDRLFIIGTNTAGLLFAIDKRGSVVVLDEIELDGPELLASSFDHFERAFVTTAPAPKQPELLRNVSARWKRLDAILDGKHALSRTANVYGVLVDIANQYLLASQPHALLEALREFVERHPRQGKTLAAKIRKYAKQWPT